MSSRALLVAGLAAVAGLLVSTCATPQRTPMVMGDEACEQRLLVAAQQTEYKNAVFSSMARRLEREGLCMEVIDVVHLEQVEPERYAAMVLSSEVRGQVRDGHVDAFIERLDQAAAGRVVMLTTAGSPNIQEEAPQVDGITAASELTEAEAVSSQLAAKVEALLSS